MKVVMAGSMLAPLPVMAEESEPKTEEITENENTGSDAEQIRVVFKTDDTGVSGMPDYDVSETGEFTLPEKAPEKAGAAFEGWAYGEGEERKVYKPGDKVSLGDTREAVFTAVFEEEKNYTVTYVDGDKILEQKEETDDEYTITMADPEKDGFYFQGWMYGGKLYKKGDAITADGKNITLEATFKPEKEDRKVKVIFRDGTTTLSTKEVTAGSSYEISTVPEKAGYTFLYYETSDGKHYTIGDSIKVEDDVVLKAVWRENTLTVKYMNGTASFLEEKLDNKDDGLTITVTERKPEKKGYIFAGWKLGNTEYKAGDKVKITQSVTFTALFEPEESATLTVVYESEGKTFLTEKGLPENGKFEITITDKVPTRSGYTFEGWTISGSKDSKVYKKGDKLTVTENTRLVPKWSKNNDTNGKSPDTSVQDKDRAFSAGWLGIPAALAGGLLLRRKKAEQN